MRQVQVRPDDLARPSTGWWTPGLAIFIAVLLGFIVTLPIAVDESPAAPMLAMFGGAALVGGIALRQTPKRHENWAAMLSLLACVALIALMGWPDILNLAGFIGAGSWGCMSATGGPKPQGELPAALLASRWLRCEGAQRLSLETFNFSFPPAGTRSRISLQVLPSRGSPHASGTTEARPPRRPPAEP